MVSLHYICSKKCMIKYISLLTFCFVFMSSFTGEGSIVTFANTKFKLVTTDTKDEYFKQLYLPEGQTKENFYEKFSFFINKTQSDIITTAKERVKKLKERQESDPLCKYEYKLNGDNTGLIVSYFVSDPGKNSLEYNLEKYEINKDGPYADMISIYRYTYRAFGDDITSFMKFLDDNKAQYLQDMWKFQLQGSKE